MKKILLLLFLQLSIVFAANQAVKKIFLVGDSTVTNYRESDYPMAGWGQVLQRFLTSSNFIVDNRAIGGRSSRSFIEEGRWNTVKNAINTGDFVLIQFGHNDRDYSKAERYTPPADYKNYLKQYVNETRSVGGIPVLVTPMVLNAWRNGAKRNVFTESGAEYVQRMKEVANELNVPLIDLNQKSFDFVNTVGVNYATRFIYNSYLAGEYPNYPNGLNDGTHFQEMGALKMAKFVVEGIQSLKNHADVGQIATSLLPQNQVTITSNVLGAGTITRSDSYPLGATVTLKALVNNGHTFLYWKDATNKVVSTNNMYFFTMGSSPVNYVAVFDNDNVITTDCAGVIDGKAVVDNCGICTEGTTNRAACSTSIEAELACSVDGVLSESDNAGFKGTGYVNTTNAQGSSAVWGFNSETAQTINMTIRFANGGTAGRNMTLMVNGVSLGEVMFPSTGAFTSWLSTTVSIPLKAGGNKLELIATTDGGGPNIDLFALNTTTVESGSCTVDCNNQFGGLATVDDCGVCAGGGTGLVPNASCIDCNGQLNGTAAIDDCGLCTGGSTEVIACTGEVQGEEACEVDGVLSETVNTGFIGAGYANTDNVLGASINYFLTASTAGNYTLTLRFANGGTTNRDGQLFINGNASGLVSFAPTDSWTTWKTVSIQVNLEAGRNELKIEAATESGLANLDMITWSSSAITKSECIITDFKSDDQTLASVYPNPFHRNTMISTNNQVEYTLFNSFGQRVETGVCNGFCEIGTALTSGVYQLIYIEGEQQKSTTIIKQ